jgi:DNA-binding PadR family transcriptional regulator
MDRDEWLFAGRGRWRGGRERGRGRWGVGPGGGGGGDEPGWPFGRWFGDRPPRAERGNVRYLVLDAIADAPRHGYEIMQVIEERSRKTYRPSPGVIYPTLQMLEELGHVRANERDDKKVYAITAAGTRELAEHKDDVTSFYEQTEDVWEDHAEAWRDVKERIGRLFRAFRRAGRRGRLTPQALAKVRAILDEAVSKLEALVED